MKMSKNKELKELTCIWYEKLKNEGFVDIEVNPVKNKVTGNLYGHRYP